ncbi:MAG: helix-turn-helix transcriptional regulator [Chloroflexi bacterium]|nr:helix-turn-helix transcriptional regulator [Chloroflexota bacterium]
MIKNERQYRITKAQANRFAKTLESLRGRRRIPEGVHPRIARAQEEAVESQLADLEGEMREYEELKAGVFQMEALDMVGSLAVLLVKARIAQDLTQRELAELVGIKEQQIQRYEATDYASASLSRIREVVDVLLSSRAGDGQPTQN